MTFHGTVEISPPGQPGVITVDDRVGRVLVGRVRLATDCVHLVDQVVVQEQLPVASEPDGSGAPLGLSTSFGSHLLPLGDGGHGLPSDLFGVPGKRARVGPPDRLDFPLEMIGGITVSTTGDQERVARLDVVAVDPGLTGPATGIDELYDSGPLPAWHHVPQGDKVAVEVEAQRIVFAVEALDPVSPYSGKVAGLPIGDLDSAGRTRPGAHQHLEANLKRRTRTGRCVPRGGSLVAVIGADVVTATIRVFVPVQQCLRNADPDRRRLARGDKSKGLAELVGAPDRPLGIRQDIAAIDPLPGNRRTRRLRDCVAGGTRNEAEKDCPMTAVPSQENRTGGRVDHRHSRSCSWDPKTGNRYLNQYE